MPKMPDDLVLNTADMPTEEPAEEAPAEETKPVEATEEAPAEEPTAKEAPAEEPKESGNVDVLALLKESLSLKDELAKARKEIEALQAAKADLEKAQVEGRRAAAVRDAGLSEECARFLPIDDEKSWEDAIKALQSLRGDSTIQRDPAADAAPDNNNEEKYVRNFLGLR